MPCSHELCMPCFRQNVEQSNLSCPMCRLRISNWARKHSGRLINEERWRSIREAFPVLCQKRMEPGTGEEGDDDDVLDLMTQPAPPVIHVAEPGEIGEEFKKENEKMNEEYRRELEDAVKRSEEYIRELQKEEVKRFEERQEEMLSQEKQDAELARRLAKEEPDAVIHRGEKVHVMREQVLKDEELARRIQMSEQSLSNTPVPKSPDIVVLPSSGGSSRKNSASSSTMKCLSIEKFMSPVGRKSKSPEAQVTWEGAAIQDQPSTSACSPGPSRDRSSPSSSHGKSIKRHGAFSPVVLRPQRLRELDDIHLRAHSTDSNDSISEEMNHFKPIHVSPRTAHKKLPDGRAESPPIVFTTPRNLQKMEDGGDATEESSIKMSSLLKARWKDLETERTHQVSESSKATMTSLARLKKQLSRQQTSKHVRQGDHGGRQGEPPQKKAKVEMSGAGDAPLRMAKELSPDAPRDKSHTLLQMRVEDSGKTDTTLMSEVDDSGDATDYNHNCNNSRTLDAKLKSSSIEKCDNNSDKSSSGESGSNGEVNARVGGISGKSRDEVDGCSKESKPYKKKVHTPIKEYAMREHTKLQTRVTNSIKDLFNARRSKLKASNGEGVKNCSAPLLPSLPKTADGLDSRLENSLANGKSEEDSDSSKLENASVQQTELAGIQPNKTESANGSDPAVSNQRCNSGDKVEVSYEDWLKSNECEKESMQGTGKGTGNVIVSDSSMCETSQSCRDSISISKLIPGAVDPNSTTQLTICDDSLTFSDDGDSSAVKMASQDSDVSMASVDVLDNDSGHLKNKSNGERRGKNRGKVKPVKGSGSSRKSPRKSGDTILRYMELLDQEQQRLTQEDEDRLLAERLQREFNKEVRQRENVDRSKGTEDAYELRRKQRTLFSYME